MPKSSTAPALTILHAFANEEDGRFPAGGLALDAAGNLFGTTLGGGPDTVFSPVDNVPDSFGTIFAIAAGTHAFSTRFVFDAWPHGAYPRGGLIADPAGNFYGIAQEGGDPFLGGGAIFKFAPNTNELEITYSFNPVDGGFPAGIFATNVGEVFVSTPYSSNNPPGYQGNISSFSIYPDGSFSDVSLLFTFPAAVGPPYRAELGTVPSGALAADKDGMLFGTTTFGGNGVSPIDGYSATGNGTLFMFDRDTGALTKLLDFDGPNGARPQGDLVSDGSGNIFGTTYLGGSSGHGVVFEIAAESHAFTILANLDAVHGAHPAAGLLIDAVGNLFGVATQGGSHGAVTIFKIAAGSHALTTVMEFAGTDGRFPHGTLVADADGTLYGTTEGGGTYDRGTVFQIADAGFYVDIPLLPAANSKGVAVARNDITLLDASFAGQSGLTGITLKGLGDQVVILGANSEAAFGSAPIKLSASRGTSLYVDGSTVSSDLVVIGGAGNDSFLGGSGDDACTGGAGADLFDLSTGGHDLIKDFDVTRDVIRLAGLGLSSFDDLADHIKTARGNTIIALDVAHEIKLSGVTADTLTAGDFLFA